MKQKLVLFGFFLFGILYFSNKKGVKKMVPTIVLKYKKLFMGLAVGLVAYAVLHKDVVEGLCLASDASLEDQEEELSILAEIDENCGGGGGDGMIPDECSSSACANTFIDFWENCDQRILRTNDVLSDEQIRSYENFYNQCKGKVDRPPVSGSGPAPKTPPPSPTDPEWVRCGRRGDNYWQVNIEKCTCQELFEERCGEEHHVGAGGAGSACQCAREKMEATHRILESGEPGLVNTRSGKCGVADVTEFARSHGEGGC